MIRRSVLLLILFLALIPARPATAQTGAFCVDYAGDFTNVWQVLVGTSNLQWSASYVNNPTYDSITRAAIYNPMEEALSTIQFSINSGVAQDTSGTVNVNPVSIEIRLSKNNSQVFDQRYSFNPAPTTIGHYWNLSPTITLPLVQADYVWIEIRQATNRLDQESNTSFYYQVSRLCGQSEIPTATPTPIPQQGPSATPGATRTPYPSTTPRPTSTGTQTRTPQPTATLIPSWTPQGSWTPQPTWTGTITTTQPTQPPQPTQPATPTLPPQQSPLTDWQDNTPAPPQANCTDLSDLCAIWPAIQMPQVGLQSPTPVNLLPPLTALPSTTPAIQATNGTPGVGPLYQIANLSTSVSQLESSSSGQLVDGQGTPVYAAQKFYEAGAQIGGFFSVVKTISQADIGPVGGFLLFLLAMILLNIQIRILLFIVPIILKIIGFFLNIFGTIGKFLAILGLAGALILIARPAQAQGTIPAPTASPTPSPFPTWTPTGTLYAPAPSATSKYGGIRPTPSPFPYTTPQYAIKALFDTTNASGTIADQVINEYRYMNQFGVMDMISFFFLLLLCIALALGIYKRLNHDV